MHFQCIVVEFKLLKILERNPELSQCAFLAKKLGISLGKANYCLQALIDKGLVKVKNFKVNPNKWQYSYLLTLNGIKVKGPSYTLFFVVKAARV